MKSLAKDNFCSNACAKPHTPWFAFAHTISTWYSPSPPPPSSMKLKRNLKRNPDPTQNLDQSLNQKPHQSWPHQNCDLSLDANQNLRQHWPQNYKRLGDFIKIPHI